MKRLLCLLPLTLALAACPSPSVLPPPSSVSDRVILDEQAALSVELAYKAARVATELAVDAGIIKGPLATQFAIANAKAFGAVRAVRAAYDAGNAASYDAAIGNARLAVDELLNVIGRK